MPTLALYPKFAYQAEHIQVAGELKKMTAFIQQEALEKGREIQIKADEEFAIEKSKLVRSEIAAIDATYDKKFKQAGMSQQITRSTVANKTRLRILGARQELLDDLFERTRSRLNEWSTGKEKGEYGPICKNLILQGCYALNEANIAVRARKEDYDTVKKAMTEAQKEYKDKIGKDIELSLDEKNPQPEGLSGGLSIVGSAGKIDINNTFEERLRLLETDALPHLRVVLFGENQNRRFKD